MKRHTDMIHTPLFHCDDIRFSNVIITEFLEPLLGFCSTNQIGDLVSHIGCAKVAGHFKHISLRQQPSAQAKSFDDDWLPLPVEDVFPINPKKCLIIVAV